MTITTQTPSTFHGSRGRAWRLEHTPTRPEHAACLAQWLLDVPGAHPFWQSYLLSVVHLRPIEGTREPSKWEPENTHELMLFALDPSGDHEHDGVRLPTNPLVLAPQNLVEQFAVADDDQAKRLAELLARAFVDGVSSPDSDYRSANVSLIQATAEHFRQGRHSGT